MIQKIKTTFLLVSVILLSAFGLANGKSTTVKDGVPIAVIQKTGTIGQDRSGSISASIDGHNLTIIFLANLGLIREFATVHLGTADGEKTVIGSDCLFMCYCHAAHGVILGNHVICSNSVQLAGDVHVDDYAIIGGMTGSHQFCHIGRHAMVGGAAKIRQDFPPYMLGDMVEGSLKVIGPNVVGLTRRGFSRDVIHALKDAHRFLYRDGLNRTQALDRVENDVEPFDEVKELVAFYRNSQRGVS